MTQQRKLAAIMFTDLVGYVALSQRNEALALELLKEHQELLRPLFTQHHGTEIKTIGDAFLVEFGSAVEAAMCAIDIQKMLVEHNASATPERRILLRIGLHVGDVVYEEGDVLGDGVNIASRIEPLAEPGGICISEDVAHQVRNKIDGSLEQLGERKLKGIAEPVTVYRLVLPWEAGALRSKRAPPALRRPAVMRWLGAGAAVLLLVTVVWWLASRGAPIVKPGKITSIAVLPLDNLMNDPQQDYFVDGLHEALLTELSRVSALRVISRTSVMGYRQEPKPIPVIAEELGVDAVVEGSVLYADGRVRINAQLIGVGPERHLWANTYERELGDVLLLLSELARAIVGEINVTLIPTEERRLAAARSVDPEAYGPYLKGRYEMARWTPAAERRAIEHFQESIHVDPSYAPAHSGLSYAYIILTQPLGSMDTRKGFSLARAAAERALELDPELSEPHANLGAIHFFYDWDWGAAEREFRRAVDLNPGFADGRSILGFFLAVMGRSREAIPELVRAMELDPLSLQTRIVVADGFVFAREFERAIAECRYILELDAGYNRACIILIRGYEALGRFEEAIETYAEGRHRADSSAATLADIEDLRRMYASRGPLGYWEWWLQHTDTPRGRQGSARTSALVALGRVDELMALLQRWYEERHGNMATLRSSDYDPVRDEPRFQALLRKMGLE